MLKIRLFLALLLICCSSLYAQYINKSFLRYDRTGAINYARDYWSSINDKAGGYKNFGKRFQDPSKNWWESCKTYGIHPNESDCGGDCANFVSQCLLAGGISEFDLIQAVNDAYISFGQSHKTIAVQRQLHCEF